MFIGPHIKYPLFFSYINETWNFLTKFFHKYSDIKFCDNHFSGPSRAVPCGRTDGQMGRHDEANSRFSQFCQRIYKLMTVHSSGPEKQCVYYGVCWMLSGSPCLVRVKKIEEKPRSKFYIWHNYNILYISLISFITPGTKISLVLSLVLCRFPRTIRDFNTF